VNALASALTQCREQGALSTLSKFGFLSPMLGDNSVSALCQFLISGFSEVSLLAGRVSDGGALRIVSALGALCRRADAADMSTSVLPTLSRPAAPVLRLGCPEGCRPPHRLSLACAGGDNALAAFEELWKTLSDADARSVCVVEVAFAQASPQLCWDLTAKYGAGFFLVPAGASAQMAATAEGAQVFSKVDPVTRSNVFSRFSATRRFPEYLEEVLFRRLMLRTEMGNFADSSKGRW